MSRTCTNEGCDRPLYAKGLCSVDYQRARYHGELPPTVAVNRPCANCGELMVDRKYDGAKFCSAACKEAARPSRGRTVRLYENCQHCGGSLAGRRLDARFCSNRCGQNWRNAKTSHATLAARLAARSGRVCVGCGGAIASERRFGALYCSEDCKIRSRRHEAYSLTKLELGALLAQHEVCAICRSDDWGKKGPQVDHCHDSGRVRGILCGNCNQGLGRFMDNPDLLNAAAIYLKR